VLKSVLSGGRRLVVHANSQSELRSALELCEELAIKPAFLGVEEGTTFVPRLKALQATVLLPPLSPRDKKERLGLPAALAAAGVPFGFVAEHPDQLRLSAALALRHGTPRLAVLAALTQVPAELLGAGEQCGTLLRGRFADFVVFDGDPLELTSRITAVYAAGQPVPAKEGS
jgi:imidazolonepropionase-like amidohydrolase